MASHTASLTVLSSLILRLLSYVFFRWIPGHQLPPIIYSVTAVYVVSFFTHLQPETQADGGKAFQQEEQVNGLPGPEHRKTEGLQPFIASLEQSKNAHIWRMVAGLPSPVSILWSLATVMINVALVLGVLDVVYRGPKFYQSHDLSFARVGFVSERSAKILLREPDDARLPISVSYREAPVLKGRSSWKVAGTVHWLSNDTDFTTSLKINRLHPDTLYQYDVSNNHTGFFKTAPSLGRVVQSAGKFTFLTSSCIKTRFPYNPLAHPLAIPGLKHLAKWIPRLHASFMLFLGDFIYVDVPHRFGTDPESYRREYRQVYSSPDWPSASANLPWIHVIDDHEIANDWDGGTGHPYPSAIDPWNHYHASVNPPPAHTNASYFQFAQGPASFFMMDTRRYRDVEHSANAESPTKSMLGQAQLRSLLAFLKRDEPTGVKWKFVISSIPFTQNWRINSADTWAGYLYERRIILEAMWDVGLRGTGTGVVVLSGDRHEFAATAFPPPKGAEWPISATVHEFSTSPLSMFYLPFRSYYEVVGEEEEEVCIKYVPDGNSKFGAVELEEVKGGEQGLLRFRLFIDGVESWDYVLMTPPAVSGGGRGKDAVWG